ncbi:uncharacterized protein LOC128876087 isoform X1 [Hylaeus volcanicus]|uniref:uncharacterized protein LOC128876087 isoform X1 n=1 Tax=Hylaeus volcanicus TaxID=313075 RepID=UPI0023B852E3|nr:uncharacterized protein LOC128876087 isoform X1 [Hylaeus volcanicus]
MSESPKMGLFGSKDETNETKTEAKDDSPDRYAPYCIDSDSETYDTEALSIMDINDIIGVQSEPVSDSTLESEIAALSQIITESKTDGSQNVTENKFERKGEDTCKEQGGNDIKKPVTNEHSNCAEGTISVGDMEQLSKGNSQFSNKDTLTGSGELSNEGKDIDTKDNCETIMLTDSAIIMDVKDAENVRVISETDVGFSRSTSDCTSEILKVTKEEVPVNKSDRDQQCSNNVNVNIVNNEVKHVKSDNGIRGSLQLIGEAYSSEDSQDTNDGEPNEVDSTVTSNEEKEGTNDSRKSSDNVDNIAKMCDSVSLSKPCTNENIPETIKSEADNMEVDASNSSIECKHAEDPSSNVEKTENIISTECEVDSSKNVILEVEKEEINADPAETDKKKAEVLQGEKSKMELEENETMECSEIEVNEKNVEPVDDTCALKDKKCETEIVRESTVVEKHETGMVEETMKTEIVENDTEIEKHKIEIVEGNTEMEKHETEIAIGNTETKVCETEIAEVNAESKKHETEIVKGNTETETIEESTEIEIIKENTGTEVIEEVTNMEKHETDNVKENKETEKHETIIVEENTGMEVVEEDIEIKIVEKDTEIETVKENAEMEILKENTESEIHEKEIVEGNTETDIVESNTETKTVEENTEAEINETKIVEENTEAEINETKIVEENTEAEINKTKIVEENTEIENAEGKAETEIVERKSEAEILEGNTEIKNAEEKAEIKIVEGNTKVDKHEETIEFMDTQDESSDSKISIPEENIKSQEDEEHMHNLDVQNNLNNNNTLNTESNDVVNTNNDMELTQKENEIETESGQTEDEPRISECQQLDSQHTKDNLEVLEPSQEREEMNVEKLEITEVQEDSLKPLTDQLNSETKNESPATFVENPTLDSQSTSKLSLKTETLVNDSINVENSEISMDVQTEDSKSQNVVSSEAEKTEPSDNELPEAMETSVTEDKPEDELKTCTSVFSDTTLKHDEPMEVQSNLDLVPPVIESVAISNTTIPIDTSTVKNDSEDIMSSPKEDSDRLKFEMEVINTESSKIDECIPEEQIKELKEVQDTTVEEIETEEITNKVDIIEQHIESKDTEIPNKQDTNLNLPEESKVDIQTVPDTEDTASKILVEYDQLTETETSKSEKHEDRPDEEDSEQLVEDNIKPVVQEEADVIMEETKESVVNEDQIPDLKSVIEDSFMSQSDCKKILVQQENVEEEDTEEELNLTLEPDETDMQLEIDQNNLVEKSEKEDVVDSIELTCKEDAPPSAVEIDDVNVDSLNVEKLDVLDENADKTINLDNTGDSMTIEDINKNQELPNNKQQLDDSDSDGNTLKNILETSSNVEEMFTGEQSQNTEDIVKSILDDDIRSATDFKNILTTEASVANEIEQVFQQSADLPLVEAEIEELSEKLPHDSEDILNKDMEDTISTQNMDSLEGLLGLDLMHEGVDSTLKTVESEEQTQEETTSPKDVDMSLLLEQSNDAPDVVQASDYITDVISSCLTDSNTLSLEDNIEKADIADAMNDKIEEPGKELDTDTGLPENELDIDFEETPLESVGDLEETEAKLDLAPDLLLSDVVEQSENLNDGSVCVETSQPSSEISELESAVKFLQESEEQAIDSPLVLSPKLVDSVVNDIAKQTDTSSLFVPEELCEDPSELVVELESIATDSISISEAEIISEAAKLESERKLAEQVKLDSMEKLETDDDKLTTDEEKIKISETEVKFDEDSARNVETLHFGNNKVPDIIPMLSQNILKASETIPKISILEERLKEPPKIEIPIADMTKVSMSPTTSKDSLLISKDAKLIAYQKMLESPKMSERLEPKITETPRKDSEKHDFENVGSPRIILKIAKSAITDCGEPRSPKSPKIRSAANSPNPEDSPGQKLGKIKLKLSKGGHPSIISNENIEDAGQWYSEGSLSPIGMKIKLSKSGDVSIVSSEKHETDDSKEPKHKFEEAKRTESPIGMKIKLSKSGDASIVQQDAKDTQSKHKEKLDMVQGSPKRTESPIGMKIKLSKTGDASIIQPERHDAQEEYREMQLRPKDASYDSPKRTDSPIGMKIKLSKTGDASIVSPDMPDEGKESSKAKEKMDNPSPEIPKRTDSPIGMKIKLAMTKGGASIIPMENVEDTKEKLEIPDVPKRTESPLGMRFKLSKSGDASIVHSEVSDENKDTKQKEKPEGKDKVDTHQDTLKTSETPSVMKIKVIKSGETSMVTHEPSKESEGVHESSIGMKIKLSKFGDPSIVPSEKQEQLEESRLHQEAAKRTESPIGMKIKLSKTGDASIIQSEVSEDINKMMRADAEHSKAADAALGMKIKLLKTGDASIVDTEKKERQQKRRDIESPLEMKIKLSKTGHPTIVACDNHGEPAHRMKEASEQSHGFSHRYKESVQAAHKEPAMKILKTSHPSILQSNRSELTIEPVQMSGKKAEGALEISPKRKDVTIAPIEAKKSKLEAQLTQILPEVTIQPVATRDQKQFVFDTKTSAISLQQMNVISQEISITQVRPLKPSETSMSEKLKDILAKNTTGSPMNSDCEIIEHRPELIIVNENSNSSQDVVIIEEVPPTRMPEVKVPKKRGRPRRNPLAQTTVHPPPHLTLPRDPLSLEDPHQMQQPQIPRFESRENERPRRTCRSQKSYAPPKRGRGRGRGKRKLDSVDLQMIKKPRMDQDLTAIEASTTAVITIDDPPMQQQPFGKSPELYKVLKQPAMDAKVKTSRVEKKGVGRKSDERKNANAAKSTLPDSTTMQLETGKVSEMHMQGIRVPEVSKEGRLETSEMMPRPMTNDSKDNVKDKKLSEPSPEKAGKTALKSVGEERSDKTTENVKTENKETLVPPEHLNWLTPTSKRPVENVSTVQVIDEETRMSAESGSRSQTPARNISAPASETIVNEESQGSVLSTATTESEKVKVKNRRMEINFDPDEGPFTVDKIAEYEWPLDRKGETIMIQEQISQYLGVKSFKRKYPDLKRRVVDMEERNYLRENGLVSEAMCDMGLTAICSSEVLDVMCSDFPDQYEEYRKHMREKQVKEHSKKQKELTAAANAEKNRIDLAEMAVQSALSWNISLNKARRENRKCSLDLQTFTVHVPKKQQKVETERKVGHYPVALIPGQYTDYYREYTPAELRYYPLNTVLYGPMRPNERKFDSQSEGSQSDSDSDSSSDDSSSSSSEGTQDTEGSQSTMDEVDMEIVKEEVKLKCKMCLKALNKHSKNELLIQCGTCHGHVHPSCIDLTLDMVPHIQSYAWQCTDCKTCAQCHDPADEDKMLFCDMCDRGYHIYCVGLRRVPQGRWHCQECAVCANCSSREPGGMNSDRNSVAQWQHEYKKGDKNTRVYVSTLCVPCSKLWRKGRYCPHCSRCHTAPRLDLEANLVHCSACDKYLHLGCVETKGMLLDRKNYLCDFCAPNRQQVVKPLVSKTLRT